MNYDEEMELYRQGKISAKPISGKQNVTVKPDAITREVIKNARKEIEDGIERAMKILGYEK